MDIKKYQEWTKTLALKPTIEYTTLGLTSEAGEVAGKVKKYLRGDYDNLSRAQFESDVRKELGGLLWYVAQMAELFDTDLEELADINHKQLESRKARGTLQGNGDDR